MIHVSPRSLRAIQALLTSAIAGFLIGSPAISSAATVEDATDLVDMSLEELLNMEITTLSRKAEDLTDAPAAVFVISQSDIQRSGARSIPDLLRMVPGMQVAQMDSNKWAVTARGANGRFANKLLVLMDGRSVYSPLLGGVYWDIQDTDMSAIERIEVIRGPGATMWGSNAVNGVVNIITKNSADTQGGSIGVMTSSPSGVETLLKYGGETASHSYRVYAKAADHDGNVTIDGDSAGDQWDSTRIGGRLDWLRNDDIEMVLSGEAYTGKFGATEIGRQYTPPYEMQRNAFDDVSGGFMQFRWFSPRDDGSSIQFLTYLMHEERDGSSLGEKRDTYDIDMQYRFPSSEKHDLMWGLGYRHSRDRIINSLEIQLTPGDAGNDIFSAFIQDDIRLSDNLRVIVGSKFENHSFSHRSVEIEPSVRFSYRVSETNSLWAAVSRAVRTPSRGEKHGSVLSNVFAPGAPPFSLPLPLIVTLNGDESFRSEEILAYELGYRFKSESYFVDVALFYNDYDMLRSVTHGDTTCEPTGEPINVSPACMLTAQYLETGFGLGNENFSESMGLEAWLSTEINEWWRIQVAYTYYYSRVTETILQIEASLPEDSPKHQLSVRSSMDVASDWRLDLWARYVDKLESQGIDGYTTLDLRMAWQATDTLEVSAVGRNLVAGEHLEFVSELADLYPVQIEPQVYVELRWNF